VGLVLAALLADGAAFYPDDPLWRDPPPRQVKPPRTRRINEYYDFFRNTFFQPGKEVVKAGRVPRAGAVNTLGEVPDSAWYTNRRVEKMTTEELARGPGDANPPSIKGRWKVLSAKQEGVTPGFIIEDAMGRRYVLKLDPVGYPELATGADVVGSKFFHALGYNVPENYIVRFTERQLELNEKSSLRDYRGVERAMNQLDVRDLLKKAPRDEEGRYRGVASLMIPGDLIGPFRYNGVRSDDPNDIVPHEDRRDLRGLSVFAAWLNHTDSKSLNSLDTVVEENGRRYVKHYLIDFGAALGSDSFAPKSPRNGNIYQFDFKPAVAQFLSLGLYVPAWQRASFPRIAGVGNLEYEVFDPERWKSNYPNPAFERRLPDDAFWAAKKVMALSDEQIRTLVATGQYGDPRAPDYITRALIARRDKVGRAFLSGRVLPLDGFDVRDRRLVFEDLAVKYGFAEPRAYHVEWRAFDNESGRRTEVLGSTFETPEHLSRAGAYATAEIRAGDANSTVTVYVRNREGRPEVVGIDRGW
jgi:hypothetical protein